jgi:LysM repeat protein
MRIPGVLSLVACCAALTLMACGDGGSSVREAPDVASIATATLPAELPEPRILGVGAVQGGTRTYTVRSGDTLSAIAARFGIGLEELRAANPGLDSTQLTVGAAVRLPDPEGDPAPEPTAAPTEPPPADTPVPAEPDTPTPAAAPTEPPPPGPTNTPSPLGQTYVVQSGDIPVSIAQRFGITVEALLAANPGIDPNGLQVGQVLVIPPPPAAEPPPAEPPA